MGLNELLFSLTAGGDFLNTMTNVGKGTQQGRVAGKELSAGEVLDALDRRGLVLSPEQQTKLQLERARKAYELDEEFNQRNLGVYAGLGNQAANLKSQRQMALNAQQNAALNTANQLSNLSDARRTASNTINNAGQIAASLFR